MDDLIVLHRKELFGGMSRVAIPVDKIWKVCEEKSGSTVLFSRQDSFGSLYRVRCVESFDEVMKLI